MSSRTCNSIVCRQLLMTTVMTTPLSIIFCVYCMYFRPNCDPSSTGRCLQISGMFKRERGKMHPRMDNVWWVASHASRKKQRAVQISGLGQASPPHRCREDGGWVGGSRAQGADRSWKTWDPHPDPQSLVAKGERVTHSPRGSLCRGHPLTGAGNGDV